MKSTGQIFYSSTFSGWLVGCVLRPIDSEIIKRRNPHLLSLAKDVKLGFYTVPTRNRTPGTFSDSNSFMTMGPGHRHDGLTFLEELALDDCSPCEVDSSTVI